MRQIKLTMSELAVLTGIHRQSIAKRLAAAPSIPGSSCERKFYDLGVALKEIYRGR